ncbi:MAG: hypothetical protein JWL76_1288 [Thermoleophilia bacterium]|nr:hypothetical protein [Thermoleophilia bacterium]
MSGEPLVIDVRIADHAQRHDVGPGTELAIVVEPLYGCVAVAAALDAGWESVEIAPLPSEPGAVPIPLVSFEQSAPRDGASTRCRVRSSDLTLAVSARIDEGTPVLLAGPVNARPMASAIARLAPTLERVTFVPAPCGHAPELEPLAADAFWAVGMLIRVLLEELDDARGSRLTDSAGLAVSVAQGAEDAAAQLSSGARWRDHLAAGGHGDDLRVASAVDSIGVVPAVTRDGDAIVARPWMPEPVSSPTDA